MKKYIFFQFEQIKSVICLYFGLIKALDKCEKLIHSPNEFSKTELNKFKKEK